MPVCLGHEPSEFQESDGRCIDIGLLNNMPDAALPSTERQFMTLMDAAAGDLLVRLSLFALPDVPRTASGRSHVNKSYYGMENLWDRHLDGLIITGAEPQAQDLRNEPYWGSLGRVMDWAEQSTYSTVLSCLGAHAGVLHLDGIERRRLSEKCFGLFECTPVSEHPLTNGVPSRFPIPQSRWNTIPEDELTACGYHLLTRSKAAGVDMFVKQRKSLFIFFQGHPEYEADTLFLEYRRDVGRYLRGERDTYPLMPRGYFDADTADVLAALQKKAQTDRREELLADVAADRVEPKSGNTWRSVAANVYRNWLAYLCAQKQVRLSRAKVRGRVPGSIGRVGASISPELK